MPFLAESRDNSCCKDVSVCLSVCVRFTPEEKAKRPQYCHLPFSFGPRNCIGMRLALLEAKLAIIETMRKFSFVQAPDTEVR